MRWIEKEVANLELSRLLKEVVFPQEGEDGYFWHYDNLVNGYFVDSGGFSSKDAGQDMQSSDLQGIGRKVAGLC